MKRFVLAIVMVAPFVAAVGCGGSESRSGASAGTGGSAGSSAGSGGSNAGAAGHSGSSASGGSGGSSVGGSSMGASAGSGGSSGAGDAAPCGTTPCGANQYCVVPCCGGTAVLCFQPPDGGTCPEGSTIGCFGGASYTCTNPATCCQPAPCKPPPPYCSDTLPSGGCLLQGRTCRLACA